MTTITCDMCGKQIHDASRHDNYFLNDRNYYTVMNRDVCPECKEELENAVREAMYSQKKYSFATYKATYQAAVDQNTRR